MPGSTDPHDWQCLQVYQRMLESSNLQEKAVAVISLKVAPESRPPVDFPCFASFPDTFESSYFVSDLSQEAPCHMLP